MLWKFYTCLILTLATQDQAEKRETTSRAIGGPVSGLGTVNSDTDNGSQEDDRCKLVFLLKTSKLLLWKGLIYSYIEMEKAV